MSSPRSFILLMRLTLAKPWSVYLAKTQTCFSLLVCWVYREEMECKVPMELWATVSAVAWHARPQQLRHDLVSIPQSHDQCAKHLAHWRRMMHSDKWAQHRQIRRRRQTLFFHHNAWSATGDIHGVSLFHTLHQEEENPASTINQPVPAHAFYNRLIDRSCCRRRPTSQPLTSQLISLSLARISGMASQHLLLFRLT